jgi:hypothetical protein
MTFPSSSLEGSIVSGIRRLLAVSLVVGMVGTGVELLLIGHYESAAQYAPLVMIGAGLAILTWYLTKPGAAAVRLVRLLMIAFLILGGVGIGLHVKGNAEFALEMYPAMRGWELTWKTLTGATPVLAPATMSLLGLIGFAQTYRHPVTGGAAARVPAGGVEP